MTPLPVSVRTDSLAERGEFELPVLVSKLSYGSIVLGICDARTNVVQNLGAVSITAPPSWIRTRVVRSGLFLSGRLRNRWLGHRRRQSR